MTDSKIIHCAIVICNWRYATFKKVYPQGTNSMDRINQAGCIMSTWFSKDNKLENILCHDPADSPIDENMNCIPIRISDPDEVNLICSDWCTSGSPLKELNYDSIPRWWPVDWIYNKPGELPDVITIDLGKLSNEHIILECEVVKKPSAEVMCTLFSDIFIEGVDDQNLISDRRIDDDKNKNDDIGENYDVIGEDMSLFKKKSKVEEEPKSEVSKILEASEQINSDITDDYIGDHEDHRSDIANNKTIDDMTEENKMSEKNEETIATTEAPATPAKPQRKKVPTWAKIVGGTLIVAAATTATVMIVKKVNGGDDKASK